MVVSKCGDSDKVTFDYEILNPNGDMFPSILITSTYKLKLRDIKMTRVE